MGAIVATSVSLGQPDASSTGQLVVNGAPVPAKIGELRQGRIQVLGLVPYQAQRALKTRLQIQRHHAAIPQGRRRRQTG